MDSPPIVDEDKLEPNVASGKVQEEELYTDEAATTSDNANDAELESNEPKVHDDETMGPFQQYFSNVENVPEKKRLPYIMMVFAALGYEIESIYPYSEILKDKTNSIGGGGWKRSLKPTKEMMAQEILRQSPNARLNIKNVKIDEFVLRIHPLTHPRDVAFVLKEEKKIRERFFGFLGTDFSEDEIINKDVVAKPRTVVQTTTTPSKFKTSLLANKASDVVSQYRIPPPKRQKTIENGGTPKSSIDQKLFPSSISLSSGTAERGINAAINYAHGNDWNVAVAVVDVSGTPLIAKRMDGSSPASYDIALGRAKTAAKFYKSTSEIEKDLSGEEQDLISSSLIYKSGGCPIFIQGKCIGAIGVNGAVASTDDEQIAKHGVSFICNMFTSSS